MRGSLEPGWSGPALGMPPRPFLRTIGKGLQDTPHASVAVSSRPFLCSFPTIYPGEKSFSLAGEELRRVPGWSCQDLGLELRSFCPGWDSVRPTQGACLFGVHCVGTNPQE